jgi:hypothetical protein
MPKNFYLMPNLPDSGKCDQDFSFMSKEKCHRLTENVKKVSIQEAASTIDKLIKYSKQVITVINKNGQTEFI